ncbi:DUF2726 domain-containing protein [Shewanella gelidimarina]|uniref:DUF2726 domain-containing protein n=1 Tax=Shewanella gelidimarina TaxID=56813 RepID=UPI00200E4B01|nr:DUF2726 domain-containing protein [Shewanella gelidimarina]MCL1056622.1 DUF2726 domain-containing protein [Shewanella gelidimarina]
MNVSIILSYAFMYFVFFLVVPFVLVMFTLTCIKFFKPTDTESIWEDIKFSRHPMEPKAAFFINNLNTIVKDKYNILYGTCLDSILDIDKAETSGDVHSYLRGCHLDYVLVDSQSSSVKLVITDPEHNSPEQSQFIDNSLAEVGVKVIHLAKNQKWDESLIRNGLAA